MTGASPSPTSEAVLDRVRGILLGAAVGDALGAPVEFDRPESIAGRRNELRLLPGGGSFGWAPGEFTDDTQMSITLARHLAEGHLDQVSLAKAFANWATHPATADVGNQTRLVLSAVAAGVDWREATRGLDPTAAGNGSLMRTAPAALAAASEGEAQALARLQSEVTHPNALCQDACAVFSAAVFRTVRDGVLPPLAEVAALASEPQVRGAVESVAEAAPPKMSGFVLHTLTGALWAVYGATDVEEAIWRAVRLGCDADTVAAVAGALSGALWGRSGIPDDLASRICSAHPLFREVDAEALEAMALQLHAGRRSD